MPDNASFWDKIARRYAAQPVRNEAAYKETIAKTKAHLGPEVRALEIGCGTGTTALLLADAVGRLEASDISSEMIAIAEEKRVAQNVENVSFVQKTLSDGKLGEGPYDAVLAFNLLHLLEDLEGDLTRIHALVKPGGLFISKTPCLKGNLLFTVMIGFLRLIRRAPHVRFFKTQELEAMIEGAGFEIAEKEFLPPPSRYIVARKA